MKQYDNYKDSKVDWIGEIPEHWDVGRIKNVFREINKRSKNGLEDLLSVSQYTGVNKRQDGIEEGDLLTNAASLEGYKLVEEGDLVSNIMLAWKGSLGFSPYQGIVSPAYSIYRIKTEGDERYFHYLFRTDLYKAEFKRQSTGVIDSRLRLYTDSFFNVYSILPSLKEQTTIANFLDDKTEKIDRAIKIKQREIELLNERRQILIQEVVTGKKVWASTGSATGKWVKPEKTKDSGVDWIGEIPEDWAVRRFKYLVSITTGAKNTADRTENGKYPFFVRSQIPEKIDSYSFDGEAILTAGDGAGVGKVYHYINGKFDFHQRVYKFSDFKEIEGKLLFYYLKSLFYNVALLGTAKSTVDSLRLPLIQNFPVVFPISKNNQNQTISYLEKMESKIEKSIALKEQEIEKLQEYKTVLIDSAVTGKIKVETSEKVKEYAE